MADLDPSLARHDARHDALTEFDQDADKALLNYALSTGFHGNEGVRAAQRLECAGGKLPEAESAALRDKMRDELEASTVALEAKMASNGKFVQDALRMRNQRAPVFACASCGEKQFHREWLKHCRIPLSKLDLLRYRTTGDEAIAYDVARDARIARAGEHGVVFSRYCAAAGQPHYHVHQELVDAPGDGFEPHATEHSVLLCPSCAQYVHAYLTFQYAQNICLLVSLAVTRLLFAHSDVKKWHGSTRAKFEGQWRRALLDAPERLALGVALLEKHRPRRSIAAGHDCGNLRRAGITDLSWLSQMGLNTGRLYMHVCKVSGATGGRGAMHALRGHCITFPQPLAPERTAAIAPQVRLPRTDLHERISVVFVGPQGQREQWAKLTLPLGDMAIAHYPMMIRTLKVLKAIECPEVADLEIDESDETKQYYEGDKNTENSLLARLHAGVTYEEDEVVVDADFIGNNGDNAAALPQAGAFRGEGAPSIAPDATVLMEHCFYGQDGGVASGDREPAQVPQRDAAAAAHRASQREYLCSVRDLLSPLRNSQETLSVFTIGERVQLAASPTGAYPADSYAIVSPFGNTGRDQESRDGCVPVRLVSDNSFHRVPCASVRRLPAASDEPDEPPHGDDVIPDPPAAPAPPASPAPPQPRLVVTIPRGDRPMNEFTENARIITSSFICAFPLGEGVVRAGSLSTTDARHLLLQWNPAISRNVNLLFLLFNQRQRHGALQHVAAAVRNNNTAFKEFQELISNPDIGAQLDAAIASPDDAPSRALIQKLKRIMQGGVEGEP
jgi:hypothetical protein